MKPIGGFFELELPRARRSFHPDALALCTGRACVGLIVERLKPERVFLPFYSCEALAAPLIERGIAVEHLAVDANLELKDEPTLGARDLLIYVNFFGIKRAAAARYASRFGSRLVLDNTQAFFEPGLPGVWSFNSARKFFGVPDGAYLYSPEPVEAPAELNDQVDCTHLVQRFNGRQREGYGAFQKSEASLTCAVRRMSPVSAGLLSGVDYTAVSEQRRRNFERYQSRLATRNQLRLEPGAGVPFCYPFLPAAPVNRAGLAAGGIFIPTFWPELAARPGRGFEWERKLAAELLPLPVDHRYGEAEIEAVISAVLSRCQN